MTVRRSAPLVALLGVAGCMAYAGGARPIDPARVTAAAGWIIAPSTPALRQRDARDCGAAALAIVANRWQVGLSVAAATAALPAATLAGVRLADLRTTARAHDLAAFAVAGDRATLVHELRAGRPVIVGLVLPLRPLGPLGGGRAVHHYEVVVAMLASGDQFATIDPASGWRARSWAALDAEWRPAGRPTLVVLGRASGDRQASSASDSCIPRSPIVGALSVRNDAAARRHTRCTAGSSP